MKNFWETVGTILGMLFIVTISWSIVYLLLKTIFWCLGITFTWKIATGIYLIFVLINLMLAKTE